MYEIHYNPTLLRQPLKNLNLFLTNPRFENHRGRQIPTVSAISAWSIASRNRLLSRGQFRPKERVVPPGTKKKAHHPVTPFSLVYRRGKARGGCGRHSTVTKGNHHRSGGTGTSSGHKLSKSRRYFAESSAKRTVLLMGWKMNKSVREVRYKSHLIII